MPVVATEREAVAARVPPVPVEKINTWSWPTQVDELLVELAVEGDNDRRNELAVEIQQQILEDVPVINLCHLKIFVVTQKNVVNAKADPCEYYYLTQDLDVE